jgi:epoxide hydrolase
MPPRPFTIDVPQSVLDDLNRRLDATRWPEPLPGEGWERGANLDYVKELCAYWRNSYDWRSQERELNRYPGFLCEVDGVDIHFWHVRGKGPDPFPLLLIHGWPGSIYEFHHLIGPLTDPAAHGGDPADAFDVVVPALPGYGWSGKPKEPGWGPARMAAAFDRLMTQELGYSRYGSQGGDWGSAVTSSLGANHADHVAGIHLNMAFAAPVPGGEETEETKAELARRAAWQANETGYSNVQGTKPMSLAIAQSDSPAGIAAWIVEKLRTWSDCNGDVESVYSKDQMLTNVMFYWAPNSIASAANLYYEQRHGQSFFPARRIEVPTGYALFPEEITHGVRSWMEPRYNIQRWTVMPRGGHFAAFEQPELLLEDVRAFFRMVR